jgi:hypothetical protein
MKLMCKFRIYRKRLRRLWLLLTLLPLLASCATTDGPATKVDPCAGWSAIYPSRQDVLTDGTAKQILAHDLHGVAQGCWKAPKKKAP